MTNPPMPPELARALADYIAPQIANGIDGYIWRMVEKELGSVGLAEISLVVREAVQAEKRRIIEGLNMNGIKQQAWAKVKATLEKKGQSLTLEQVEWLKSQGLEAK